MGGYGSGRWGTWGKPGAKTLVEDCRVLDIFRLVQERVIGPECWRSGRWVWSRGGEQVASVGYEADMEADRGALRLIYSVTRGESRTDLDYRVELETTALASGGRRWWFRCPAGRKDRPACGRRCAKLYLPPGGMVFACRTCYELAYTSSRESRKWDRMFRDLAASTGYPVEFVKRALTRKGPV